jgi:hypothetical protein
MSPICPLTALHSLPPKRRRGGQLSRGFSLNIRYFLCFCFFIFLERDVEFHAFAGIWNFDGIWDLPRFQCAPPDAFENFCIEFGQLFHSICVYTALSSFIYSPNCLFIYPFIFPLSVPQSIAISFPLSFLPLSFHLSIYPSI